MNRLVLACALIVTNGLARIEIAKAEVSSVRISFAGGCTAENAQGSCTLRIVASGSDLETEKFELYASDKPNSQMNRVSLHNSSVDESGVGRSRVRNRPGGCFQIRTARNGNENRDVYSRVLCEAAVTPISLAPAARARRAD